MTSTTSSQPLQLNWTTTIFYIVVHAIALLGIGYFSWQTLVLTIFLHWLFGSIGICLGYHRMLSHRSFYVPKWLEYVFTTIGAMAMQGGPIFWVGGHRQHHGFTEDNDKDPYSATKGLWWSHMAWILYSKPEHFDLKNYRNFAPDLASDRYYQFLDKYFLSLQIPLGILLYFIGSTIGQGIGFVLYGIFVRVVLVSHSTWLINSACHKWGYRNFDDSNDKSVNLWWAALLTYGEGWHNNHHAYPKSARAGLHWWEIDVTWAAISLLKTLGLAQKVYLPEPWQPVTEK
ncbi:fatty acid desaturase [Tumidithrix elongata RA019]|uniref:Fatty acid desaturase n=1 Tax=Tumidithrix elongata BACA0141 TaxID=2716417 RepID=A0AAW9PZ44_9CYAN|nr:fatty acid desaturase [Tumidithrix elongata RA019]